MLIIFLLCRLYYERLTQVEAKLQEVRAGRANEYLSPLAQLQDDMRVRTQVAGILRELKIQNIRNKFEAEEQASHQHFDVSLGFFGKEQNSVMKSLNTLSK